mgnify:CR=1 FL=1
MIICTRWQPYEKNTLRGFADLYLDKIGMTIRDCALHDKSGKEWIAFPSKPRIREGKLVIEDGRLVYDPPLISLDEAMRDKFRDAAVKAIHAKIGEPAAA